MAEAVINDRKYTVVLLRHGESEWIHKNIYCGWYDSDITRNGEREAEKAGQILKDNGYIFDEAYTSVLRRAGKTVDILLNVLKQPDIPVYKSWRLNSRHYGALTGLSKGESIRKYGEDQIKLWRRSYDIPPPEITKDNPYYNRIMEDPIYKGGPSEEEFPNTESLQQSIERTLPYWNDIIAPRVVTGRRILIIGHMNSLRAIIKSIDRISDEKIMEYNIPTGIPFIYEITSDMKPIISLKFLGDENYVKKANEMLTTPGRGFERPKRSKPSVLEVYDYLSKKEMKTTQLEAVKSMDEKVLVDELKVEDKEIIEPKVNEKVQPTIDKKVELTVDKKFESRVDEKVELTVDEKLESMVDTKLEPMVDDKLEPTVVEKVESMVDDKLEPMVDDNLEPTVVEKLEPTIVEKLELTLTAKLEPTVAEKLEPIVDIKQFESINDEETVVERKSHISQLKETLPEPTEKYIDQFSMVRNVLSEKKQQLASIIDNQLKKEGIAFDTKGKIVDKMENEEDIVSDNAEETEESSKIESSVLKINDKIDNNEDTIINVSDEQVNTKEKSPEIEIPVSEANNALVDVDRREDDVISGVTDKPEKIVDETKLLVTSISATKNKLETQVDDLVSKETDVHSEYKDLEEKISRVTSRLSRSQAIAMVKEKETKETKTQNEIPKKKEETVEIDKKTRTQL